MRVAAGEAVETLRAALHDELASNRIRAAIALLDIAVKTEVDDLARRVDAIEAKQRLTAELDQVSPNLRRLDQY